MDVRVIYPNSDRKWVRLVQEVPKKGGMMVVKNEKDDHVSTRTVMGCCMCIDYRKINKATRKYHSHSHSSTKCLSI